MINVIVTYQINQNFISENIKNIERFLKDFRTMKNLDFSYSVYLNKKTSTFTHISCYSNKEIQAEVLNVKSFKSFQEERDKSGLNGSHNVEFLEFLGSNKIN